MGREQKWRKKKRGSAFTRLKTLERRTRSQERGKEGRGNEAYGHEESRAGA